MSHHELISNASETLIADSFHPSIMILKSHQIFFKLQFIDFLSNPSKNSFHVIIIIIIIAKTRPGELDRLGE